MGRGPDKKPRATPNRVYATVPDEEASRVVPLTVRPYHLFLLDILNLDAVGLAPRIQRLIEDVAAENGIGTEEWQRCQEKEKYMRGRRTSPIEERQRKRQRRIESAGGQNSPEV